MKKSVITLVILIIFAAGEVRSQVKETVYFKRDFAVSDSATDFRLSKTKQKKNKIIVDELTYNGKNWDRLDKKIYQQISDSVYINKTLKFNKNTLIWNTFTPYKIVVSKTEGGNFYFKEYNFHAVMLREGNCKSYFPLVKQGEVKEYYVNGNISNIAQYNSNKFVSSERWMMDGSKSVDNVYSEVEELPLFKEKPVDLFYNKLGDNFFYPLSTNRKDYVDGNCRVEFVVKEDGSISNIQFVENSNFPEIDIQIYRFILKNKSAWSPAKILNEKVNYVMHINLAFQDTRGNYPLM